MTEKKSGIKPQLVRDLAELLVELDLNEVDVKDDNIRIRLTRGLGGMVAAQPVQTRAADDFAAPQPAPVANPETVSGTEVPSPMVGTVYLSPSPDTSAYVEIGSKVQKGDTLLIIEAMKTMNHIPSPQSGTIVGILVDDKQPVEFGEPLMIIG